LRLDTLIAEDIEEKRLTKCKNCGADLLEGANFCHKCGSPVGEAPKEEYTVKSDELVRKVKILLHEGNVRRIIVKDEKGKTLLEIPAWAGFVGAVLAPWLAALGVIAAIATKCTITVVRRE